jgi:hypothetical protein
LCSPPWQSVLDQETKPADALKKFVRTTRRCRTVQTRAEQYTLTAADPLSDDLREALTRIGGELEH